MAGDPRSAVLQMMMQQLAGGEGQMQGRLPDTGSTDMDIVRKMQESQGAMRPGEEIRRGFDEPVPQTAPGMQGGLPPEVMKLASMGIRPGDLQQSNPSMRRPPDRATDEEDVDPMESYGKPGDEKDPRFGPQDDPVRDETEGELEAVREKMGAGEESGETDWEGDRTPTQADLDFIKEHPTDGNLSSFFQQFPTWTAEDILMRGGNPSESPDEYAASDEEWQGTQKDRSTRIDER